MKILLAEDNERLRENITEILTESGYIVDVVEDGVYALSRLQNGSYDVALLDIMMPRKSGTEVCTEAREQNILTPIIIITAKGTLENKIEGLDSGANDYLVKPFEMEELLARIRAHTRIIPTRSTNAEILSCGDITISSSAHTAQYGKYDLKLTTKEFLILEYLLQSKGRTITREQILEHCWDFAFDSLSNIVDVNIKQLRKKISKYGKHHIKTIRGIGYQMV